jgi:hypothetical protein
MITPSYLLRRDLYNRGWIIVVVTLFVLVFPVFWSPAQTFLPSSNDLWDISQGSVVTATSPLDPGNDGRDIFGGHFGSDEYGNTIFADGQPAGFVHYVEWHTPGPVTVGGLCLVCGRGWAAIQ